MAARVHQTMSTMRLLLLGLLACWLMVTLTHVNPAKASLFHPAVLTWSANADDLSPETAEHAVNQGLFTSPLFHGSGITLQDLPKWVWLPFPKPVLGGDYHQWVISLDQALHHTSAKLYVARSNGFESSYQAFLHSTSPGAATAPGSPTSDFILPPDVDLDRPILLLFDGPLPLTTTISVFEPQDYDRAAALRLFVGSLFLGILLALCLYNLGLYQYVQDPSYLFYVGYVASLIVWLSQATGMMAFLSPSMNSAIFAVMGTNILPGITALMGGLFAYYFLDLKSRARFLARIVLGSSLITFTLGLMANPNLVPNFFGFINAAQHIFSFLQIAAIIISALHVWRRGQKSARYFILAWGFLTVGVVLFLFQVQIVISDIVFHHSYNLLVSAAFEAILFAFALGDRIRRAQHENETLQKISITDQLTKLHNQGYYKESLPVKVKMSRKQQTSLACVVIDVDHFKKFNDTYGHPEGDVVLEKLGALIGKYIRRNDMAFRSGGEEFTLLIENENLEVVQDIVDRLRLRFMAEPFTPGESEQAINVTFSAGIAQLQPSDTVEGFVKQADKALYKAKELGRNRVEVFAS